jgi:uncharacterized GH25 family protein
MEASLNETSVQNRHETPVIYTSGGPVSYVPLSSEPVRIDLPEETASEAEPSKIISLPAWSVVMLSAQSLAVILSMMWWGVGWSALRRWWKQGKPLQLQETEMECVPHLDKVEVRSHPRLSTPCAFGWWRWKILMPEKLADADHRKQCRMACAHEWSHLSRGDLWTWRWTRFAQLTLWMQPAYWWLRSQVRLCQDYLADSEAAASDGHTEFASFLLSVARTQQSIPGSVLSLKGKKSDLTRRIRMLVESKGMLETTCPRFLQGMAVLLVSGILGASAWFQIEAQDEKADGREVASDHLDSTEIDVFTHKGIVFDQTTDLPIEGVKISMWFVSEEEHDDSVISTEHVTDDQGKYEFTIPKRLLEDPVLKIRFNILHPDYVDKVGMSYWRPPEAKTGKVRFFSEKLPLHPARTITGQLLDPRGQPAANVQIKGISFIRDTTSVRPFGIPGNPVQGKTDAEGHFEIQILEKGIANLGFFSKDFPALYAGVSESANDLGLLRLQTGFKQKILFLDAEGKPAGGVNLTYQLRGEVVEEIDGVPVFGNRLRWNYSVVSDDSGYVSIPLSKEGTYDFSIDSGSDYLTQKPKSYAGIFLNQNASVMDDHGTIVFKAQPTVKIQVSQVDPEGNPVQGDSFSLSGRYGDPNNHHERYSTAVFGNASGYNEVEIPEGLWVSLDMVLRSKHAYEIISDDNDYIYRRGGADLGHVTRNVCKVRVIHRDLPVVLVDVVDESGERISDVKVTALNYQTTLNYYDPNQENQLELERDPDGRWRSPGMQVLSRTQIAASKEGYFDATQYVSDLVAAEVREITLVMRKK